MSTIPILTAVRLIPREEEFLDRKVGSFGEIFYDRDSNSLRLYNGRTAGGVALAKADMSNVDLLNFRKKSVEAKLSTVVYNVTITAPQSPDTGNKYNLNSVYRPEPNFVVGYTYVFVQDNQTNVFFPNANGTTPNPHPLNFSADNLSGERGNGTSYLTDVEYFLNNALVTQAVYNSSAFNTATSRQVRITVTNSTPATLYYWCWNHPAMGNTISIADPGSGSGSGGEILAGAGISVVENDGVSTISNIGVVSIAAGAGISLSENAGIDTITNTGVISIVAGTGITTSVNQGAVTINADATTTGDITFTDTTIDSVGNAEITFTPAVSFDGDVTVGDELVFSDGTRQSTATLVGPEGPEGPPGPTGSGAGDVSSVGGGYTDNALVRYNGTSGTSIQTSLASISDVGTLSATAFSGAGTSLTALNATNLGSGTIPDARFPATLPAASGVNLTALNATNLGSGTVPVARLGTAGTRDTTTFLRGDNTWATVSGGGLASDSFATIAVAGQTSVVAESASDTLTLTAGTGITITTDATTDTITIANSQTAQNVFSTVAVTGQTDVVADSSTDTLTLAAGTGISIATNAETDTVTITSTVVAGATAFTGLTDYAGLTVDRFYLPAITMLSVTNNGASSYRFDQYGTTENPTVYAINATTIAFNLNVSGHPFLIQNSSGTNYNTGLIHVSTSGDVSTGASAQGQTSGTLYWKIPDVISGGYRYQCSAHAPMVGSIFIKTFSTL